MIKCFIIILLFNSVSFWGAEKEYRSEQVQVEEGISNNLIFSIYQDSKGFIWFGTMFGLIKYDGINYTTYRYDPADTTTISNDDVISICEDRSGDLWIGTYFGGLNRLNRRTGKFTRFINNENDNSSISNNTVWAITCDINGVMWFGTNGGGLNKYSDGRFTRYLYDSTNKSSISSNMIFAVASGSNGLLWLGTAGGGLNKFDPASGIFTSYKRNLLDTNSISGNFIRSLYIDNSGNIWAGTMQRGLDMLDVSTGKFHRFIIPGNNSAENSGSVFSIIPQYGESNKLWISSDAGLFSLDKSTGTLTGHDIYKDELTRNKGIVAACMDSSGVLWLSTYNEGLHKYYENFSNFVSYRYENGNSAGLSGSNVRCFCEDKFNNLWIGTDNGLNKFDKEKNEFTHFFDNEPAGFQVNSIKPDSAGSLWLGTADGLIYFDPVSKKQVKYPGNNTDSNSISSNNVTNVLITSDGTLWAGTIAGLNRFNSARGSFERYVNIPGNDNSLSENNILSLYEDKEKNLWAGTYAGLNKYDKNSNGFVHYKKDLNNPSSLSNNYIFSFYEEPEGNLWIGTAGGLNLLDRVNNKFSIYNEKNGMDNTVICGILPGLNGDLWLSTKKGLSEFNTLTHEIKNFSADDGLAENMFNEGAYFRTSSGDLAFGSVNGFTVFNPSKIEKRNFMPPVILTSLSLYSGNNHKIMDISGLNETEITYDENIITFAFASLDFYAPKKNKFSYMLEGFENEWKYPGNKNTAVYTNLDPGKYTFRVKGTNSDGAWSSKEASITLIVKPPFWKTWWFYSLLFIGALLSVYFIHNARLNNKINAMLEIEKARELEREKIRQETSRDYHDELGHKLTRISIYTRRINKKLGGNANGITGDLNGIIEVSDSLQSGAKDLIWSLNPDEDSLYDFAVRLKDFGNSIFENTGIAFVTNGITDDLKQVKLNMKVKRHLIFIFKEAMNNTLKYASCTAVELSILLKGKLLEIELSDNGIGFDINNSAKGYGLKNIQSRAKQINAVISVDSMQGKGTQIKFEIGV